MLAIVLLCLTTGMQDHSASIQVSFYCCKLISISVILVNILFNVVP